MDQSLIDYLVLFQGVVFFILTLLVVTKNDENTNIFIFSVTALVVYVFLVFNRDLKGDSVGYLEYFNHVNEVVDSPFEIGFVIYTKIMSFIGSDGIYIISFPIILFLSCNSLYRNITNHYNLIFILLLLGTPVFVGYSTTGFRQTIAMSLGVLSISSMISGNSKTSYLQLLLSCLFHSSSFIYFFPLIYIRFNMNFKMGVWSILWLTSIVIGYTEIFRVMFGDSIFQGYEHYFSTDYGVEYKKGVRLDFVLFSLMPIFFIIISKCNLSETKKLNEVLSCYIILNIVSNSFSFIPYSDRIYAYSWLLSPIILSSIFNELDYSLKLILVLLFSALFFGYNLSWFNA